MKIRFRPSAVASLLAAILLVALVSGAWADLGQMAPINPEFITYQQEAAGGSKKATGPDGHPLGYRPSPLDLSHVTAVDASAFPMAASTLPAAYDLRTTGGVTAVRDQSPYGTCWAFASLASLESTFKKAGAGTFDFSEWHLAYFAYVDEGSDLPAFTAGDAGFGNDPIFDQGGNPFQATALLARWTGAVNESDRPYQSVSPWPVGTQPLASDPVAKHLEQVHLLNMTESFAGNEAVKKALITHGASTVRVLWPDTADLGAVYSEDTYAFYNAASKGGGHLVTLVGWNDNFSASNFAVNPGENGAWLVKNSWGTWGDEGYFWLSYADPTIGQSAVFVGADRTNYSRAYQYDPLGWISGYGYGDETAWFASVFTADGLGADVEALKAVSLYAGQTGASYRIEVYRGVTANAPRSGSLAASFEGTLSTAGYHTIKLADVNLTPGERFSVVVRLTTPGYNFPIPIEYPEAGWSDKARANAGESFISSNGTTWSDMTAAVLNANVCLKAFTGPGTTDPDPDPDPDPTPGGGGGGGCLLGTGALSALLLLAPLALLLKKR